MFSPEIQSAIGKSQLPELDASLADVKGVPAARGRNEEREYIDGLIAVEAARVAKEEMISQGQGNVEAEAERQVAQNEGLKEMQADIDHFEAELAAMKKERANWDWNNIPALVSALGKMAKSDAGLVGEFDDASKALKLMADLGRAKKQLEFVESAQATSGMETKH